MLNVVIEMIPSRPTQKISYPCGSQMILTEGASDQ